MRTFGKAMQQLLEVGSSTWTWGTSWPDSPWLNVLALAGGVVVALVAAARAQHYQIEHQAMHNQLLLGLLILSGIAGHGLVLWICAQPRVGAGVAAGGWLWLLSGVGASSVAILAVTRWPPRRHQLLVWLDIATPPALLGQALVPWAILVPEYVRAQGGVDLWRAQQPASVASAALPETLWHLTALTLVVWIERLARGRLLPGDVALLCVIFYGAGRMLSEGPGAVMVQSVGLCVASLCALFLIRRHDVRPARSALAEKR